MKESKQKQGKKNKAAGSRFELKVRKDLESKGWIVSKWMNNVELGIDIKESETIREDSKSVKFKITLFPSKGKLIPAKHKFRGPGIPMAIGTGFPDFIAFRSKTYEEPQEDFINMEEPKVPISRMVFLEKKGREVGSLPPPKTPRPPIEIPYQEKEVIGVEVKSNGYLDKIEKEKCRWLLDNNIFSKILIASKGDKRGEIVYKEVTK
ncbi:MAG: hypothetical protein IIA87_03570 [Nanoarchaeota archaeon]|nr:hypothetical protein [Nanoarchaeota archaeon]